MIDARAGARVKPGLTRADPGALMPPVAAATALLVCLWALSRGGRPTWSFWIMVAALAVAVLGQPIARRHCDALWARWAQPAAALIGLVVVALGLPNAHRSWRGAMHPLQQPLLPLWVVGLLLGCGLATGPLIKLARARPTQDCAQPLAALAALLVLVWSLAVDEAWFSTASPGTLHSAERLPVAVFRVVIVTLGLGLVAAGHIRRGPTRRFLTSLITLTVLVGLLVILAARTDDGLTFVWPAASAAAILGLGLGADLLAWAARQPQARVLAQRVDDLSRTRTGALDAQTTELRRIERDLHDGAQVRLIALSLKLGRAEDFYRDDPRTATLLREARQDATAAIRELRELARGIAPPVLVSRGLEAAVRSLAHRAGVEVSVSSTLTRRAPLEVERAAYFVVAESLANASKHASGARVQIGLADYGDDLQVEITDFGPGDADPAGRGLTGLRQRVEALDGLLNVTSPTGVGTQIEAVLPCGR